MTRKILTTCLVWALSPTVLAGVQLWSGEPNDVSINGDDVIITAPGTFKFQSVTDDELDVIGSITVADGVTGTVTIHVRRNPNDMAGDDGATHVGAINLTNNQGDNLIGNLAELRITGNLGTAGPSVVRGITGDMSLGDIENDLTVNDDVGAGVTIGVNDVSGNITINDRLIGDIGSAVAPAGDITGTITVGGLAFGDIYANSLGDVSFATGTASSYNGKVVVATEYSGTFSVNAQPVGNALIFQGDMSGSISCRSVSGRVVVQGALTGPVELSQNLTGRIVVRGDLTPPGRIEILGDVLDDPNAPIRIRGSLTTGGGASDALIKVGDNPSQDSLSGTLAVDGSLTNANSSGEEIYVASFDTLGAVAINYDGDPGEGDEWASGATVVVDGNTYDGTDGNNTTDRVWNVSPCKGDMNGDGSVETTGDGDPGPNTGPFFQSAATYRNNFPGLEGSRDWHEAIPKPGSAGVSPAWPGTFGGSGIASWRL